jgi:hypothetical protein
VHGGKAMAGSAGGGDGGRGRFRGMAPWMVAAVMLLLPAVAIWLFRKAARERPAAGAAP